MMKTKLTWLALFVWSLPAFGQGTIVPPGKVYISPDKSKSVKLVDYDREFHYAVTDEKTGKVSILDDRYNPVFAIAWSLDSQSIFAVVHVARGVQTQVLHLSNEQWNTYTIAPPEEKTNDSVVLDWFIKPELLNLICKVGLERDNGTSYDFYKCSFDVDPSSGKTSNFRKTPLTREGFMKLKSRFVPD